MLTERRSNLDFLPQSNIRRGDKVATISKYWDSRHVYYTNNERCEKGDTISRSKDQYFDYNSQIHVDPVTINVRVANESIELPYKLKHIAEAISEAEHILNYEDDWDDNGAEATDAKTFKKAIDFLISYAIDILKIGVLDKPFIDILRDGSVSIFWETPKATLLIIFKKGNPVLSYFYGEEKLKKVPFKYAIKNEKEIDEIVAIWMSKYLI